MSVCGIFYIERNFVAAVNVMKQNVMVVLLGDHSPVFSFLSFGGSQNIALHVWTHCQNCIFFLPVPPTVLFLII